MGCGRAPLCSSHRVRACLLRCAQLEMLAKIMEGATAAMAGENRR
jgi:hypothetical protein